MTLDDLGIEKPHLAGWSGGGRCLLEFAMQYPERVRSLTLVEPAAYWVLPDQDDPELIALNNLLHGLSGKQVTEDDLAAFLVVAAFIQPSDDATKHPNWERWLLHRNALSWQGNALDRPNRSVDEISNIQAPTLVVKGTVTANWLKRVADDVASRIAGAKLVELEGDHACHIQSIDAFMAAFLGHLASS